MRNAREGQALVVRLLEAAVVVQSPTTPKNRVSHITSATMSSKPSVHADLRQLRRREAEEHAALGAARHLIAHQKFHVLPGFSRPVHSTLSGPAHCGGQKPGSPQVTRAAFEN
jgi:hypothetical protein